VVVRYHDWFRHASTNYFPTVIHHSEMNIETDFLSMMAAIARNAERQNNRTGRKVKDFGTIELDDACCVLLCFAFWLSGSVSI